MSPKTPSHPNTTVDRYDPTHTNWLTRDPVEEYGRVAPDLRRLARPIDPSRPVSLTELAEWLNAPRSTLYKYLAKGMRAIGVKVGREWRFRTEEVWDWLKARQAQKHLSRTEEPTGVDMVIPAHLRLPLRQRKKRRYAAASGGSGAVGQL